MAVAVAHGDGWKTAKMTKRITASKETAKIRFNAAVFFETAAKAAAFRPIGRTK
jgi:hypothetical protein